MKLLKRDSIKIRSKLLIIVSCIYSVSACAQTPIRDSTAIDPGGPQFKYIVGSNSYDYTRVGKNTSATYQFEFKNSGKKPLVIYEMHCDPILRGPQVQVTYPQKPVRPNKTGYIFVTINSGGETGSFRNDIYVTSNATKPNYPLLHISGAVVPKPDKCDHNVDINSAHNGGNVSPESAAFEIVGNALMYLTEKK